MWHGETIIYRYYVRNTISRIHDYSSSQTYANTSATKSNQVAEWHTLRIECQHCLNSNIHASKPIFLKHNLTHLLPICFWIHRRLGQQNLPSHWVNFQFLVKCIVPEMLHVFPVFHNAMFHGLRHLQVISILSSFVADHDILDYSRSYPLFGAENRSTNYRWKYCFERSFK